MATTRHWAAQALWQFLRAKGVVGRFLLWRDLKPWLRLQFLAVATRTGILRALSQAYRSPAAVANDTGLSDISLMEAFLQLGVAVGELRKRNGRFRLAGHRARALAGGVDDLTGVAEELLVYDSPIHHRLELHLAGEPPGDYLAGIGDVIARSSRVVEPILGPFIAELVRREQPARVLDVGCGSGTYLRWVTQTRSDADVIGIDVDPDAVRTTRANLRRWNLDQRVTIRQADVDDLPDELAGPYGLVLLSQNIYYWPPDQRTALLRRLRDLADSGMVVVATAASGRDAFATNFDLVLRVTKGCWRLPRPEELHTHLADAGFRSVQVHRLAPAGALLAAVAR